MPSVATVFSDMMATLTGNTGGGVQSLPPTYQVSGRRRCFVATIAMASQVSGTVFGVARLPIPFVLTDITLVTDTSLGSTTIALGDANTAALYMAAQTLTATDTPTKVGKTSAIGVPITSGYDCQSGALVTAYAPGEGGAGYEDVILTTAAATMPSSGNLRILFEYVLD